MVKSNKIKNRSKPAKKAQNSPKSGMVRRVPVMRRLALDAPALAYARLLADPCGAPLTHPIYAGSEGGILVKAESVITLGTGASDNCLLAHWTPGAVGSNNTDLLIEASGSVNFAPPVSSQGPGNAFLKANATGARCIAACMQITYLGTELNRAGAYAVGRTQGSLIDPTTAVTVGAIEPTLEHFTRTPDSTIELRWVPANMDQSFTDPNVSTPTQERDRKSAITFVASGLTNGSGVRIRLVAIYEYQPKTGTGIATPSSARATSSYSLDDVLNYAQRATNVLMRVSSMFNSRHAQIEL